MKKVFKKINFSAIAGGLAGGAAAAVIESVIPDDLMKSDDGSTDASDYIKIGIMAVGGSVISSMSKNNLVQGVGNGMLGLAGANLYDKIMAPKDDTTTKTKTDTTTKLEGIGRIRRRIHGLGMLPSQLAVGNLPSQNAVGSARWINRKKVSNVK
ncbi:MAG: hypothetical protein E7076_03655 [Bacteroidales bacterium]|nr:hypothetical protein [Bacteroidales bacterium]